MRRNSRLRCPADTHAPRKRLDVPRLRLLPIDPTEAADAARKVAQMLRRGGTASYRRDRATSRRRFLAPLASHPTPRPPGPVCSAYVLDLFRPVVWPLVPRPRLVR